MWTTLFMIWLIPFAIDVIFMFMLEEDLEDDLTTNQEVLEMMGVMLIPIFNIIVLFIILIEYIKDKTSIEDWLNKPFRKPKDK